MTDDSSKRESKVGFSVTEEDLNSSSKGRSSTRKLKKSRSSFFRQLSASFRRSDGERGADVDTLRGKNGPAFEGYATVNRGNDIEIGCGCFGPAKDKKERLVLIKGPFLFVYLNETDKAPQYAVSLAHMKPILQESGKSYEVWLETSLGDVEYELSFAQKNIAKQFVEAVTEQAAAGEADLIKKRLGHETLLDKRKSVRYAEKVATKKVESQPEKQERLTTDDIQNVTGPVMPL